jgi:Ca-activated chloride channel family protein
VTAIYEIVPVGGPRAIGDLRYAKPETPAQGLEAVVTCSRTRGCWTSGPSTELGFVKIRYKQPKSDTSQLISTPIGKAVEFARFEDAPQDARFATSVAAFAELLRGGKYGGAINYDDVLRMATGARGEDAFGYRSEFIQMVRAARTASSMARLDR